MPIYAKRGSTTFEPAPAGLHQAICCDVIDRGMVYDSRWEKYSHKVRICWQIEETMKNGKPFLVTAQYTNSLHEKAILRAHLESWRGRPFTEEELDEFDLEALIDKTCQLNVVHKAGTKGGTFANVNAVVPAGKNAPKMQVRDYTRACLRADWKPPSMDEPPPHEDADQGAPPDDIPF